MGCKCLGQITDLDFLTSKNNNNINNIQNLIPGDEELEEVLSYPPRLILAIKNKLKKYCLNEPKFFQIKENEFLEILNRNEFAPEIIRLFSDKLKNIDYELNIPYKDMPPIKILDSEGGIQYYKGGFTNKGYCEGKGIWIKDFNIYIGNFQNDEFNGTGLFINEQGNYYFGEWKNNKCSGNGSIIIKGQLNYEGQFKNGKKEGYGEEKYQDGEIYKGQFSDGQKNGKGVYFFSEGTKYEGNFKNSKFEGYGEISCVNGNKIKGEFRNGKLNGKVDFTWNDGTKFVGNFVNDKKSGEGTYINYKGKYMTKNWDEAPFYNISNL